MHGRWDNLRSLLIHLEVLKNFSEVRNGIYDSGSMVLKQPEIQIQRISE